MQHRRLVAQVAPEDVAPRVVGEALFAEAELEVGVVPTVEVELGGFGVEGRAVLKGHPFLQRKGPDRTLVVRRPFGRETRHQLGAAGFDEHQVL